MLRRTVVILSTLAFSLGILFISILKTAKINYAFSGKMPDKKAGVAVLGDKKSQEINYVLPYPGTILPDSPFWPIKAARDKLWDLITTDVGKKAELKLLLADKRLASAKILFERGKPELGFSVLTKGEKYLEEAVQIEKNNRNSRVDTSSYLIRLANASLKHREIISKEILVMAPEDAKPKIVKIEDYPKNAFSQARDGLQSLGLAVPNNPFNGE